MNSSFPKSSLTGSWIWTLRDTERQRQRKFFLVQMYADLRFGFLRERMLGSVVVGWVVFSQPPGQTVTRLGIL